MAAGNIHFHHWLQSQEYNSLHPYIGSDLNLVPFQTGDKNWVLFCNLIIRCKIGYYKHDQVFYVCLFSASSVFEKTCMLV